MKVGILPGMVRKKASGFLYAVQNRGRDRIPQELLEEYSTDSLQGYGDSDYRKGGENILAQQRGLGLELVIENINGKYLKVVEIGTGNGDTVAYLARKLPQSEFIGIDFSVKNAEANHREHNLRFIPGYALDILEGGLVGDLVFTASTACLFTPRELERYLRAFRTGGFRTVIFNEPTWNGNRQENNDRAVSRHLEDHMWHHNYAGYLRQAGYQVSDYQFFHYRHPVSTRPDIWVCLCTGVRQQDELAD